jgi:hypothetical protein
MVIDEVLASAHAEEISIRDKSGDYGGGVTRVPIPNTTVKTSSADDTWSASSWESRTLPGKRGKPSANALGFCYAYHVCRPLFVTNFHFNHSDRRNEWRPRVPTRRLPRDTTEAAGV